MSGEREMTEFKPGDVLSYVPKGAFEPWHCREGKALVDERGRAWDTFWQFDGQHLLSAEELADAEVVFNVNDYEALDVYAGGSRLLWETYHPDDRGRVTSQHGLREALFLRRGAKPHLATQIENAQALVEKAESELQSAENRLKWRREDLDGLLSQAKPEGRSSNPDLSAGLVPVREGGGQCSCAMSESSARLCSVHGEEAPPQ